MLNLSEPIVIILLGLTGSAIAGLFAWFRSRRKSKLEEAAIAQNVEVAKQSIFNERFDDASELAQYIQERIDLAIRPLQSEIDELKKDAHETHDAFRSFFTELWIWDWKGRNGPMPIFPELLLAKLKLGHLFIKQEKENHE